MEVTNIFKRLDLIDRVLKNYGRKFVTWYRRQRSRRLSRKKKKKLKKAKWLSEEALQIAVKRSERQRRKGKIYPFECRVPKNSKER